MSQDLLGPMNIKIVTDENENHVFTSNQEKKLLFENSILFFDDQRPQSGARRPIEGAFIVDETVPQAPFGSGRFFCPFLFFLLFNDFSNG